MSDSKLTAVLWDLDGVIADTARYHYLAWQDVFKEKGVSLSWPDFMKLFGRRHDAIIRFALGDNLAPEEFDAITERKQSTYRRLVAANIVPLPGAIDLMKKLKENGIKSAIASSAVPENVDVILGGLGIESYFQAVAWGTEVKEGKPSPLIFLRAAEKLGVRPTYCTVIEDAIAGVAAAKQAGMKCVAVTNSHPRQDLDSADLIVDSLEKVGVAELKKLFAK
jgi:beta-phosphoglucomutase family hydrolase